MWWPYFYLFWLLVAGVSHRNIQLRLLVIHNCWLRAVFPEIHFTKAFYIVVLRHFFATVICIT